MIEIVGIPMPARARIVKICYGGAVAMVIYLMIFGVFFVEPEYWYYTIPFIVFFSGIFLLCGEFFAHEERRDSSSMFIGDGTIVFKNDYIDNLFRKPTEITFPCIERIESLHRPTDEGYEPHFLIIHTDDGKKISSGAKEADDLRKAVALLEAEGVRVDELR